MIPPGTTAVMPQMEGSCVTGTGTGLTARYFADHKTAVKDITPVMKTQGKNCASKAGMETPAFRVSVFLCKCQDTIL